MKKIVLKSSYAASEFGFTVGQVYECVECPEQYKDKYADDVWIFSERRGEAVRLIEGEYIFTKD